MISAHLVTLASESASTIIVTLLLVRTVTAVVIAVTLPQLGHAKPVIAGELRRRVTGERLAVSPGLGRGAGAVGEGLGLIVRAETDDFAVGFFVSFKTW